MKAQAFGWSWQGATFSSIIGEEQAQLQPFKDGGVYEGEGHPIGSPIVHADWHPSRRNAYTNVEIVLPVDGAGGLIKVVAQKGLEVAFR